MKKRILYANLAGITLSVLTLSCTNYQEDNSEDKNTTEQSAAELQEDTETIIKRGEYLTTLMGCHDCHSPKKMGPQGPEIIPELMLSGYQGEELSAVFDSISIPPGFSAFFPDLTASYGPWGISYAANLTPDESGIKFWTEDQFKKALKEGKLKGLDDTRMLLPPMPWMNFKHISDEDVHAMFTYLQSIPAVENIVPQPRINPAP